MGGDVNRQRKAQGAFPPWAHSLDAPPLPRVQSDTDTITTQYTLEQFHFCNSSYQICKFLRSQCGGQAAPAGRQVDSGGEGYRTLFVALPPRVSVRAFRPLLISPGCASGR